MGESWHLPVFFTQVYLEDMGHAICAFQIKKDQKKFDSWRFFQYNEDNIKPGKSWQMTCPSPTDKRERYIEVDDCVLGFHAAGCNTVAAWILDRETCEPRPCKPKGGPV